ncbi:hypothetical protein LZK75_11385 [Rhizobium leguminosarum]|nr:hypothetical protein LZK75_11385 [Rhizobium leguminosarum]
MSVVILTPTTELEAINLMLSVIGESPVNTVEDTGLVDAVVARQILIQSSRDVQLVGWHWNTEIDYPIAASFPEGELTLPPNTLKVDTAGADAGLDLVQRGNRLYDRKNHTPSTLAARSTSRSSSSYHSTSSPRLPAHTS